jgi:hypothetical protein
MGLFDSLLKGFASSTGYKPGGNPYSCGRPFRYYPIEGSGSEPPHEPGEYRINGSAGYIGETSDLHRRMMDHIRSGKIQSGDYFEYKVAAESSTCEDRRNHEAEAIEKHEPEMNKRRGGGGRPPKTE